MAQLFPILMEDGLLFGYLETPDFERAVNGMAEKEINDLWQVEMSPFFESLDGKHPDEGMLRLEEIFHLE